MKHFLSPHITKKKLFQKSVTIELQNPSSLTSNITHRATIIYNIAKDHLGHTIVTRPNKAAEEPKDGSGTVGLRSSVNSNAASWPNVDRNSRIV